MVYLMITRKQREREETPEAYPLEHTSLPIKVPLPSSNSSSHKLINGHSFLRSEPHDPISTPLNTSLEAKV